jgi:hypothetical protein
MAPIAQAVAEVARSVGDWHRAHAYQELVAACHAKRLIGSRGSGSGPRVSRGSRRLGRGEDSPRLRLREGVEGPCHFVTRGGIAPQDRASQQAAGGSAGSAGQASRGPTPPNNKVAGSVRLRSLR